MPQFDQFSFLNQVFFFLFFFFNFYFLISYYFLPQIAYSIKFRKKKAINNNSTHTILEKNLTLYILPKMYKEFSTYFLDTFQERKVNYNQKQNQFLIVNPFIVQKYSQQINNIFNSKFLLSKKYLFNN